MTKGLASKVWAAWAYLRRRLWTVQVLSCRCISYSSSAQIILGDAFLGSAQEVRLELLMRGPLLPWRPSQNLGIRIAGAPDARRPLQRAISNLSVRHMGRGVTRLCATVPASASLDREWLRLEIHLGGSQRALGAIALRQLTAQAAQQRLLENLRACCLRLWVRNRKGFQAAGAVAASSGFLIPEFTLPVSEFAAFIAPIKTVLTLELVSSAGRVELNRQLIELGREAVKFRGPPVRLDDTQLFAQPGNYLLVARIGGRQIGQLPFQFLSEAELLGQVEIPRIEISAQRRTGELVPGLTTLHWEEHKNFRPVMEIKSTTIAPDTLVPCTIYVRDGGKVLQQEDIVFPLDRFSKRIKLQPVQFGRAGLETQPKPARLSVSVSINGAEKRSALVLVLPPERITNFEGQLTFEVDALPFDETEYGQIVHRLGLQTPADPRRGFWQWLQAKLF